MLIGITGKAGSGKDTAFRYIKEWAESEGRPARRDAFADRLKISAARAIGFDGSNEACIVFCNDLKVSGSVSTYHSLETWLPQLGLSGREYLQRYGTEAHRDVFGQDFWISAVTSQYDVEDPTSILVITDVRFDNEAQAIRDLGGAVWSILRPQIDTADSHVSESPISAELVDHTVLNDGSLEHLRDLVQSRIERQVYA